MCGPRLMATTGNEALVPEATLSTVGHCLANGFQPWASSLWIQCDQRKRQQNVLGVKGLYPTLFPGGRSVTKIPFTQSESACRKPISASGPLCLHSRPPGLCTVVLHSCPLLCSPAALQHHHRVMPRAMGGALFIESTAM